MIRTRHNIIYRAARAFLDAMDTHQWIPLAIVGVLLLIVNTMDAPF